MRTFVTRRVVALAIGMLLGRCSCAFALNPALDLDQYAHTAWKIRDGFAKGTINAIAQTPDGYLWLGTDVGLYRFDGVRNIAWQPPAGQSLPSTNIRGLLAARDGTLWIGTEKGLAALKDGRLARREEFDGQFVGKLLEDRDGVIWANSVMAAPSRWRVCAITNGRVQCYGEDGGPGAAALGLFEDRTGSLWVGTPAGVWRWRPGQPVFSPIYEPEGNRGFADGDDGGLLVANSGGIKQLADGKTTTLVELPGPMRSSHVQVLFRDRDGGLWIGSFGGGLAHLHQGRIDVFSQPDGLSGVEVHAIVEDREGNVWVATDGGLDRFHDLTVVTLSVKQGVSNTRVVSMLAASDGSVWFGVRGGLNRWNSGSVTDYTDRLSMGLVYSMFQDHLGRVWISTERSVGYLERDRFVPVDGLPGGITRAMVEDGDANVWIANQDRGLFRVSTRTGDVVRVPLNRTDTISALGADTSRKGVWLGFATGGVAYLDGGQIRGSYEPVGGLGSGRVHGFRFDRDGTVWVSTEGGLSRLKDGRVATLTARNGLPCNAVEWHIEDNAGSVWVSMSCALVRMSRKDLDGWAAAFDRANDVTRHVVMQVFDVADGVRTFVSASYYSAPVVKAADGRLWFIAYGGAGVVDPRHLPFNKLPPPVHIEQITADHKPYEIDSRSAGLSFPARTNDLQIDYTALSLVAPEKVQFRYRLDGFDRDWQDAGTRRQAFYTNLPPRAYRFHVIAANDSGVWNDAGAFVDFSVAPAYYQAAWFRVSVVAALLALIAGLYQLRLRQVARRFNLMLETRVGERMRIARELHDTLLQSFHGLMLQFQGAANLLPDRPADARATLDHAIDQAAQAITEGRNAVQGLRASTVLTNDLADAINALGEALARDQTPASAPVFRVEVEGASRDLHPILRDEVYRIAGEALRNAFRHAEATVIEAEIRYDGRQLRVRVRDDGKGIEPALLDGEGRVGHFGLAGMRERATLAGGKLTVWSGADSGTEVELTIPASIAYAESRAADRPAIAAT